MTEPNLRQGNPDFQVTKSQGIALSLEQAKLYEYSSLLLKKLVSHDAHIHEGCANKCVKITHCRGKGFGLRPSILLLTGKSRYFNVWTHSENTQWCASSQLNNDFYLYSSRFRMNPMESYSSSNVMWHQSRARVCHPTIVVYGGFLSFPEG